MEKSQPGPDEAVGMEDSQPEGTQNNPIIQSIAEVGHGSCKMADNEISGATNKEFTKPEHSQVNERTREAKAGDTEAGSRKRKLENRDDKLALNMEENQPGQGGFGADGKDEMCVLVKEPQRKRTRLRTSFPSSSSCRLQRHADENLAVNMEKSQPGPDEVVSIEESHPDVEGTQTNSVVQAIAGVGLGSCKMADNEISGATNEEFTKPEHSQVNERTREAKAGDTEAGSRKRKFENIDDKLALNMEENQPGQGGLGAGGKDEMNVLGGEPRPKCRKSITVDKQEGHDANVDGTGTGQGHRKHKAVVTEDGVKIDLETVNRAFLELAEKGRPDTVKILIDAGADVNAKDINNDILLLASASGGHSDTVKILIDAGADVDAKDINNVTPLLASASGGHSDTVKILIDAGADVDAKSTNNDTPLLVSARRGHSDTVKILTDAGADVDAKDIINDTPLHYSAWEGHSDTVKILTDAGADVDAKDIINVTPLLASARGGHSDTVKILIDAGADVDAKSTNNDTPLHASALRGHSDTVKILTDAGADVDAKTTYNDTPLLASAWEGHSDTVKILIDAGADVDAKTTNNDTPLLASARGGHSDTVKILIDAGADVDAKTTNNDTPLLASARGGHSDTVKILIDAGADVNAKGTNNVTPLLASVRRGHSDTVKILIDAGADVDAKDTNNDTPLLALAWEGHSDTVKKLIDAGADVDAKDTNNDTPLLALAWEGHSDTVKKLIDAGADVDAKDTNNVTPLLASARGGHSDTIKILIDAGADVDAKDTNNDTPLHASAWEGHSDTVKILIDAGADVDAKNTDNDTPLLASAWEGHSDNVKILIDAGADVNAKDTNNVTPLLASALEGNSDTVKILIDAGADVNAKGTNNVTPLLASALKGNSDTVKILIHAGADVNAKGANNDTPLLASAWGRHSDTVKILIDAGADVDAKNTDNVTPLHASAQEGLSDTVKILIDAGADVNAKGANNATPLLVSAWGGHSDTVKILIDSGADVDAKDTNNVTPLHQATRRGELQVVVGLILKGANVNLKNNCGVIPIHLAVEGRYIQIINELMNKTDLADPGALSILHSLLLETDIGMLKIMCRNSSVYRACGNYGRTLLHVAGQLGCHEYIQHLTTCDGVQVNHKDHFGKSSLHYAVEIGNEETIHELLEAGCDVHELDLAQKSVLHHAAINGHCNLIGFFIEKYRLDPYQADVDDRNCLHYAVIYRNEDVVALLMEKYSDPRKDARDYRNKTPTDYLHQCEEGSLTSKYLRGWTSGVTAIELGNTESDDHTAGECSDITNIPDLCKISEQPYIGSVMAITGHDNVKFVKYVKEKVQQVIKEVLPQITEVKVIGVGSSFEASKHGMPDEFDFLVKLGHIYYDYEKYDKHEGYQNMKNFLFIDNSQEPKVIGSYGMWVWSRLMEYWSDCVSNKKATRSDGDRSFCVLSPPQRHPDRKTCTTWIWLYSDEMFTDLPISIDLVPAIEVDMNNSKMSSALMIFKRIDCKQSKKYIVPKIPYRTSTVAQNIKPDKLNQLGRDSYPTIEVDYLKALDKRVKAVFITAKCVRKAEVCGFKIKINKGDMVCGYKIKNNNVNIKSVSELVTSYRLKSVFLHLVELFLKSDMSLGKMVLMVYEHLEKCLERDNLPMPMNNNVNVLAGSKLSTEDSLQVTRIMARFVRRLYERDVSAEQRERDPREEAQGLMRLRAEYEQELDEWTKTKRDGSWIDLCRKPTLNPVLFPKLPR
ncbi:serine/threonine-protein phosphatase 6 regulatory ankyrin repeat subunit A-like [Lineus longissimus]|uniref:serine/threonine-protein phosphatase 6 regulatory ankyrin repeat subunit A-like n=1 Tax=Lineus longissimus TaxID=88925 RepID=UPI00315D0671